MVPAENWNPPWLARSSVILHIRCSARKFLPTKFIHALFPATGNT